MTTETNPAPPSPADEQHGRPHAAHWGLFTATATEAGDEVAVVTPWQEDLAPSPLLANVPGSVTHRSRVARPAVRRGWLERGPGPDARRGREDFVEPGWDEVLDRLAPEYRRVIDTHGNQAIYGGSYGWASAGRFHHAQSQLHRFLNCLGGYTRSVNSYSTGASEVFFPHVLVPEPTLTQFATTWGVILEHTDVLLCLGGVPLKNTGTDSGGAAQHPVPAALAAARERGLRIVSVSPLRDDLVDAVPVDEHWLGAMGARGATGATGEPARDPFGWLPIRPGTDVALLLALMWVLEDEDLLDREFLGRHCVGGERLLDYLTGGSDGVPKTPEWAAPICEIDPALVRPLARMLAGSRSLVTVGWSLQRVRHGEQALWASLALAACLGQLGLPGGGFGSGYGSMNRSGLSPATVRLPSLPQGGNPVADFIPVARVSDMLLHPGAEFDYDGQRSTYPDIRLVHWAGGNPFHHHQDLGRLRGALTRPDTVVVSDPYWTAMARHADIVLPSTTSLERDDIAGTRAGARLTVMRAVVPPHEESRHDADTFAALADRLGAGAAFTQGRDAQEWIRTLYDDWRDDAQAGRTLPPGTPPPDLPPFEEFWERGHVDLPTVGPLTFLADLRTDRDEDSAAASPARGPLSTPSGRIELYSEEIAGYGYADCPGHPTWLEPQEWLGGERAQRYPLHLIANQPRTRLHSQLDHGAGSQASKVAGREPIRLHPADAAARGITDGDVVLVSNDRGALLAGAVLSEDVCPQVVQLATGAWFDPYDPIRHGPEAGQAGLPEGACVHGNPNVLTADIGTSSLAQGCTGQHVLVEITRWTGPVPPVRAFDPPSLSSP